MNPEREILIFETRPAGFFEKVVVSAAHVVSEGKLLLLEGVEGKAQAGCFAPPAGKVEAGEKPLDALKRELFEETAIQLTEESTCLFLFTLYIRKPEIDYIYHCFEISFLRAPAVTLSPEHQSYLWETPQESAKIPLIEGGKVILEKYLRHSPLFSNL